MRGLSAYEADVLDGTHATLTRVRSLRATAEPEHGDTTITLEQYRSANRPKEVTR